MEVGLKLFFCGSRCKYEVAVVDFSGIKPRFFFKCGAIFGLIIY